MFKEIGNQSVGSMSSIKELNWIKLSSIQYEYVAIPICKKANKIIMIAGKTYGAASTLIEYSPDTNDSHDLIELDGTFADDNVQACFDSAVFDKFNNAIYLPYQNNGGGILKISLDNHQVEIIPISTAKEYGLMNDPSCVVIGDILHILGFALDEIAFTSTKIHVKYNILTGKITKDIVPITDVLHGFGG